MFSRFFIKRPRFALVLCIILVLVGVISLYKLPVAEYPEITPPQLYISANYTGASAAGSRVFWSEAASAATSDSLGNAFLGVAACHFQASAAKVRVILNFGHPDSEGGGSPDGIQWQTIN